MDWYFYANSRRWKKNTIEKALKIFRSDIPVEKIKDDSELQKELEKVIRLGRAAGISIQL